MAESNEGEYVRVPRSFIEMLEVDLVRLVKRAEAAESGAKRYAWLREITPVNADVISRWIAGCGVDPAWLDAAIDAAMAAEPIPYAVTEAGRVEVLLNRKPARYELTSDGKLTVFGCEEEWDEDAQTITDKGRAMLAGEG